MNKSTKPLETATRKKIDQILINLRWSTDEESPSCNVFTERAKTVLQNKKLKGKSPDYILYQSGTDIPIAVIEAKKPNGSIEEAITQGIKRYAIPLDIPIVFASDGSIVETYDTRSSSPLRLDEQIITDFLSEKKLLQFFNCGADLQTPEKVSYSKRELIKIFAEANELLRKEGLREGIERFTEFSNLLFLKLISEIENDREKNGEHRRLDKKYCWERICLPDDEGIPQRDPEEMLDYINDTVLPHLAGRYNDSGDVFQKELLIKNPKTLKRIVEKLSPLPLIDTDSDIKGDAFEYFLKNSVSVGNDLGEYFTPRHIVKLMTDFIDPKYGETVYDPCCGTGGFLIQAFRHIKGKVKLTSTHLRILEKKTVYGRELTGNAKIAKMNMILIGDGHANVKQTDSIEHPIKDKYNIVLTNFPFSQTTDYSPLYGFSSEDANPVFVKHVIDALKNGGRAAIVVPEGLLFKTTSEYVKIRKILLTQCNIIAIIQLHEFVFKPYAGQPTSIIIFEKGKQTENIWYFRVDEDGFKKTSSKLGRQPTGKGDDLLILRRMWFEKTDSSHSFTVSRSKITNPYFKLSMDNYVKRISRERSVKLEDICHVELGGTPPRNNTKNFGGNHFWAKIGDMGSDVITDTEEKLSDEGVRNCSATLLPRGTLLLSFKLTIGKVAITGKPMYTNEAIVGIRPKKEIKLPNGKKKKLTQKERRILHKYVYYLLPHIDYASYQQRAAKGKTLNTAIIKTIEIPFLSFKKQKKIIEQFDERYNKQKGLLRKSERLHKNTVVKIKQLLD